VGACFAAYTALLFLAKIVSSGPGWRPANPVNFVAGQFPPVVMAYAIGAGLMAALRLQEQIHHETLRSVRLTQQLRRTELAGIQARLRPAFFFESLDAIGSLIPRDPDAADAAVARLGVFLRYSLDVADVPEVPLEDEVQALRAYLDVLAIRSAHAVSVSVEVEDEAMGASVPPLLLQPLVDDALRTAPAPGARLRITGALRGGAVVLRLCSPAAADGDRPAVDDVRRRLRHLYGQGEHLSLAPLPGGGEVATLVIPCVSSAAADGRGTLL
jgi:two-component system, LytTR family, sensor kinase